MKIKKAFTLIETIVALAIFAVMATAIGQAIYNLGAAINIADKDSKRDATREFLRYQVLQVTDLDELESTFDLEDLDGETVLVSCEVEETVVADLFKMYVNYKSTAYSINEEFLVIREDWYESADDRSDLIDDRTDELDDIRSNY
ncbi:MAG: type II secretion system protein [Opitutales bacterium]